MFKSIFKEKSKSIISVVSYFTLFFIITTTLLAFYIIFTEGAYGYIYIPLILALIIFYILQRKMVNQNIGVDNQRKK